MGKPLLGEPLSPLGPHRKHARHEAAQPLAAWRQLEEARRLLERDRGHLFGGMQEGEQRLLALVADAQIVEAALSRREPVAFEAAETARRDGAQASQDGAASRAKEAGVPLFILRVAKIEPAQLRVPGQLRLRNLWVNELPLLGEPRTRRRAALRPS